MLKVIIVVLFFANVICLFGGAVFFFKDQGSTKRTLYALGVRITLALLLIGTIVFGVMTGRLGLNAPWQQTLHPEASQPATQP
ncbi:MAG TPA: DUF2909 domain-containing protein [Candidatus Acidoferrum sp.]|nr:DUF2909 domain-containing protein [Candidatus Acidoferrum sp.]